MMAATEVGKGGRGGGEEGPPFANTRSLSFDSTSSVMGEIFGTLSISFSLCSFPLPR